MSNKCNINTKKNIMKGNYISRSNKKEGRIFLTNLKKYKIRSKILEKYLKIKTNTSMIKEILKYKGIDSFLINKKEKELNNGSIKLKRAIEFSIFLRSKEF